jgi:hypothetical protein
MKLWVANDLIESFPGAALRWSVSGAGKTLLTGERKLDVPAVNAVAAGDPIDLSPVTTKLSAFDLAKVINYTHSECRR